MRSALIEMVEIGIPPGQLKVHFVEQRFETVDSADFGLSRLLVPNYHDRGTADLASATEVEQLISDLKTRHIDIDLLITMPGSVCFRDSWKRHWSDRSRRSM